MALALRARRTLCRIMAEFFLVIGCDRQSRRFERKANLASMRIVGRKIQKDQRNDG